MSDGHIPTHEMARLWSRIADEWHGVGDHARAELAHQRAREYYLYPEQYPYRTAEEWYSIAREYHDMGYPLRASTYAEYGEALDDRRRTPRRRRRRS